MVRQRTKLKLSSEVRVTMSISCDLVKTILSKLIKSYTGTSLARISVEVGEEEDIRLLVQSCTADWSETGENEDPTILWALKTHKL